MPDTPTVPVSQLITIMISAPSEGTVTPSPPPPPIVLDPGILDPGIVE